MKFKSRPKYGNRKTKIGEHTFDSQKEASRYVALKKMQEAGLISGLELQKRYNFTISGAKLRYLDSSRAVAYVADFVYTQDGIQVVEDVKSEATKTTIYKLKKALMWHVNGIKIKET